MGDRGKGLDRRIWEERLHRFSDFRIACGLHPKLRAVQRPHERFNECRVILYGVGRNHKGGIRHFAGFHANVCDDVSFACGFKFRGCRFKKRNEIAGAALKCAAHQVKLDVVDDLHIHTGGKTVLLEDVFERHKRHATGTSADNRFSLQGLPIKRIVRFAANEEGTVALGELGNDHRMFVFPPGNHVNAGFRAHQRNVRFPRKQRGHAFVTAAAGHNFDLHAFRFKESA